MSAIDVRDIGAVAAAVLSEPGHLNRTYTLTGRHPHRDRASPDLSGALGRDASFVDASPEAFAQALAGVLPEWQIAALVENYAHYRRGEAATTTTLQDIAGRSAIPIDQFDADFLRSALWRR